jgi:hypothetical protein
MKGIFVGIAFLMFLSLSGQAIAKECREGNNRGCNLEHMREIEHMRQRERRQEVEREHRMERMQRLEDARLNRQIEMQRRAKR